MRLRRYAAAAAAWRQRSQCWRRVRECAVSPFGRSKVTAAAAASLKARVGMGQGRAATAAPHLYSPSAATASVRERVDETQAAEGPGDGGREGGGRPGIPRLHQPHTRARSLAHSVLSLSSAPSVRPSVPPFRVRRVMGTGCSQQPRDLMCIHYLSTSFVV